ncbi:MAG: PD-(D/E)XK nuclease superfamily protein [Candidatus Hydrothermarchaeaceae archaeon]
MHYHFVLKGRLEKKYVDYLEQARVLEVYSYSTTLRKKIKGECATHEIDIIAEENGKKYIIECKYQNSLGTYVDLKEVLYTCPAHGPK